MSESHIQLAPFVPEEIPDSIWPMKYKPNDLQVGTSVFYHNERYWVEVVPSSWLETCSVRITDKRPPRPGLEQTPERVSFCVHPDTLELAPVNKNPFGRQPTKAAVVKREAAKAEGRRDNGDEVATMLRGKSLDEAYEVASELLGVPAEELKDKYAHLDHGRQRMVLGNRMRAILKGKQNGLHTLLRGFNMTIADGITIAAVAALVIGLYLTDVREEVPKVVTTYTIGEDSYLVTYQTNYLRVAVTKNEPPPKLDDYVLIVTPDGVAHTVQVEAVDTGYDDKGRMITPYYLDCSLLVRT